MQAEPDRNCKSSSDSLELPLLPRLLKFAKDLFVNKNTLVIFISNLANIVLGTTILALLSGNLSLEAFGAYSFIVGFIDLIYRIIEFGINTAVIKFASTAYRNENPGLANQYFKTGFLGRLIINGIVLVVGLLLIAPLIVNFWGDEYITVDLVRFAFLGVVFFSFFQYIGMLFQTQEKFFHYALLNLVRIGIQFGIVILVIFLHWDILMGALSAFIFVPLISAFIGFYILDREFLRVKIEDIWELNRNIFKFGRWMFINISAALLISNLDIFMAKSFLDSEGVAIYYAAFALCSVITALNSALTTYLLPEVSRLKTQREFEQYFHRVILFFGVLLVLYFPISLLAPFWIPILFSRPEYLQSVLLFQILFIGFIFTLFRSQIDIIFISRKKAEIPAVLNLVSLGLLLIGYVIIVPFITLRVLVILNMFIRGLGALFVFLWAYFLYFKKENQE